MSFGLGLLGSRFGWQCFQPSLPTITGTTTRIAKSLAIEVETPSPRSWGIELQ